MGRDGVIWRARRGLGAGGGRVAGEDMVGIAVGL